MLNSTDNMLKLVEHSCDDYARMSSKLSCYLLDFEAEYDVPIGVHIKEVKHNLLRVGIIQVDIIPKCKKLWDNKFHKDFCEYIGLKLITIHDESVYHMNGNSRRFTYDYTYSDNFRFNDISPDIIEVE